MKPEYLGKVIVFQACIYVHDMSKCAELHSTSTKQMGQHSKNTERGKVSEMGQIFNIVTCSWNDSGVKTGRDSGV